MRNKDAKARTCGKTNYFVDKSSEKRDQANRKADDKEEANLQQRRVHRASRSQ